MPLTGSPCTAPGLAADALGALGSAPGASPGTPSPALRPSDGILPGEVS